MWEFSDGLSGRTYHRDRLACPDGWGRDDVEDRTSKRRADLGDLLSEEVRYAANARARMQDMIRSPPFSRKLGSALKVFTSEATTQDIRVRVVSRYSLENSQPEQNRWFFLYTVEITNQGSRTVQLVSRHWIIENADKVVKEVRGPGVVGEQPTLAPGESFEYSSGCPLGTSFGSMRGTYQMTGEDGTEFDVEIAPFTLSEPYTVH